MRESLSRTNRDLLHQILVLRRLLTATEVDKAMRPYVASVLEMCRLLENEVTRLLRDLEHSLESTIPDILEATQRAISLFDIINTRFSIPIVRYCDEDRLPLAVLSWLHSKHPKTQGKPFAVSDGGFSIYPTPEWPVVYLLPVTRRLTLLLLPLLYHEFGHLLYACHKPELDELVGEFQLKVLQAVMPTTFRDRGTSTTEREPHQVVAQAWYPWTQEVFCDAIGLVIGGACYIDAFSHYFRFRSLEDYYLPRRDQLLRKHPVTRMRMKFLLDRADRLGLNEAVVRIGSIWSKTAAALRIHEDYEGIWLDELLPHLTKAIDDMLEECSPVAFHQYDDRAPTPIISEAWARFESGDSGFIVSGDMTN